MNDRHLHDLEDHMLASHRRILDGTKLKVEMDHCIQRSLDAIARSEAKIGLRSDPAT